MSQQELAAAAGVSVDLIRKLEQGQRHAAQIGSLHRIARALDREVADLLGREAFPEAGEDAGVLALRRAVTDISDLLGTFEGEPVPVGDAERTAKYLWGSYWSGKYDVLTSLIPVALTDLQATLHDADDEGRPKVADALARTFWVAACTLAHLHQPDAAFIAGRRSIEFSGSAGDELLTATLRGSISWQLLVSGRYKEAVSLATKTAESIEPTGKVTAPHLSTYGSLITTAATAAARNGRAVAATDLLAEADEVARRIGHDRDDYQTAFGPSQVAMQTVDVHVVTEDYGAALRAAKKMPQNTGLPLAAQARHMTDRALAHTRMGHDNKALQILLATEDMAPDWMQHQSLAKQVTRELQVRETRKSNKLRDLAIRIGVGREIPRG
ncbi:helix-turn-helix domain-containing protein [Amycolatopsis sp. lyj-84]|uniref:helix-turn-helix domain-containing protein n=1 Tax=Amycolatopsis sp. lyj-84 TaxID=2789284 RepID=UPI00397A39E9